MKLVLPIRLRIVLAGVALLISARAIEAADATYTALRSASPESRGIAVSHFRLERDVFSFEFESGAFYFLSPAAGRPTGAVFVGTGRYELRPARESERRHLQAVAREKTLEVLADRFDSLVLLFTDSTAEEIRRSGSPAVEGAEPRAAAAWERFQKRQKKEYRSNFQLPLLEDLLAETKPADGLFLAGVEGKTYPPVLAAVVPGGVERLGLATNLGGESSALYVADAVRGGFWYLDRRKGEGLKGSGAIPAARARSYSIDTSIEKNSSLSGTTTIELTSTGPGLRVVPLSLMGRLRISEASISAPPGAPSPWSPVEFIQEKIDEDSDAAVVLPRPLSANETCVLRVSYAGRDVLTDAGDGNYYVRARENWYPNLGIFQEPSPYTLTYRFPKDREIVSVGEPGDDKLEGNRRASTWKTAAPIRVAGFNYGRFKRLERKDRESGFDVTVFTNPGTPDIINEINTALKSLDTYGSDAGVGGSPIASGLDSPFASGPTYMGNRSISIDTEQLAQSALADGVNSARVFTAFFGPIPGGHAAITQQSQWDFGQSWPSLIYLPYQAFIDAGTRHELGMTRADSDFIDLVGPHEFAHQWWGHRVGWASYRDQWLSEGFAEFSAALVLESTGGIGKSNAFWEQARKRIVETSRGSSAPNFEAGPLTLGWRLSTDKIPSAYSALVYSKGAYVLHMLRMLMRDTASPKPDAAFISMMSDFASSFAGKNPSTADFQATVERHMVPAMNANRDGKIEWFFKQWVDGTEIPRYTSKLGFKEEGSGHYRITGSVTQDSVPDDFKALVPIYLDFGKGRMARLGVLPVIGKTTIPVDLKVDLAQKPKGVLLNVFHEVLAR